MLTDAASELVAELRPDAADLTRKHLNPLADL